MFVVALGVVFAVLVLGQSGRTHPGLATPREKTSLPRSLVEPVYTPSSSAEQVVVGLMPYYSYKGSLVVKGDITITGSGILSTAAQTLSWNLVGVDPDCNSPDVEVTNSCGIHIHAGLSCDDDAKGHYWNSTFVVADPWLEVRYIATLDNSENYLPEAQSNDVKVTTGFTNYDVLGHTMVVHDSTGARVACGIISGRRLSADIVMPYVGYKGPISMYGNMLVEEAVDPARQKVEYALFHPDMDCSEDPREGVANACGIHIHEGKSCYEPAGGHFWNKKIEPDDPWKTFSYEVSYDASYSSGRSLTTGFDTFALYGRAVIVHDATGGRIACGILGPPKQLVNAFVPYFSYKGTLLVSGSVELAYGAYLLDVDGKSSQQLAWTLDGVDPDCATVKYGIKNACGVHIHAGMDCTSDSIGHYYNQSAISADPWLDITYQAQAGEPSKAHGTVVLAIGLTSYDVLGHTIVVHDGTGARIACGILNIGS